MRILTTAAVACAVLCVVDTHAQNRSPLDLATAPVTRSAVRLSYGADAQQIGELSVPDGPGPHPLAVVIHGGCWLAKIGNMDERAVALDNMRPLAGALGDAGLATWNIEYRRLGHQGGGWPGTFQDVGRAADFLRTLARSHNLDLRRVIAIGHSAGAHLALWLAGRPNIAKDSEIYTPDPLQLTGVVSLDGPADLKATIPLQQPVCGAPVITDLMGGAPELRPERYRAASPIELLPLRVPHAFFTGGMFNGHAASYELAVKTAGDVVRTVVLPDTGHFVFIDPKSSVWPQVLRSVRELVPARR